MEFKHFQRFLMTTRNPVCSRWHPRPPRH